MQVNNFENFYYLGSSFEFDDNWESLDIERFSLYDPYHDFETPKDSYAVFTNEKLDILFAFNNIKSSAVGSRPYDYQLFVDEEKFVINNSYYSLMNGFINQSKYSENGIFVFTKSKKIEYEKIEGTPVRCDYGIYGPIAFSGTAGASSSSFDFEDESPVTLSHTYTASIIMSCFDVGHIVYMEVVDPQIEIDAVNNREVPCITRTMGEHLKLILEWKQVSQHPFNSKQDIAICANNFLNEFKIDKNLELDIWNNQTDMQIVKYIKGEPEARTRPDPENIKEMTNLQKKWVLSKFIYKGYENMKTVLEQEL